MNNSICHIVGACGFFGELKPQNDDLLIAADGGLKHLERLSLSPDLIVGDFDSLGYVPMGDNILRHPVMKDDTDTMLAVKIGLERGYKCFRIYGGVGGRLDHTLANLQALCYVSRNGGKAILLGDSFSATAVTNDSISFDKKHSGILSVFCFGEAAKGVYLRGLKYPLTDATLTADTPLGVSNEFTADAAEVEVKNGTLVVMWNT